MILKNIGEKFKTALSLVLALLQVVLYYGMLLRKTVQSFIDYLSQLLFNVDLKLRTYLNVDLMSFSSGILLVTILLLLIGIS